METTQTHTGTGVHRSQTGVFADEDTSPDTMTQAEMQNTHPDVCGHTCAYTHSHTESPPDTYTLTPQSHSQTHR